MQDRQTKKLLLKYSYLQMEHEEIIETCNLNEKEISEYIKQEYPKHFEAMGNITKPKPKEDITAEDKPQKKHKDVRKIYRKIASKIHPDKNPDSNDELFTQAAKAYSENNLADLLQIAVTSNVEIDDLSKETIDFLIKNIEDKYTIIEDKKQTTGWAWGLAETKEQKEKLVMHIFLVKGVHI
jgi:hypothetical protein